MKMFLAVLCLLTSFASWSQSMIVLKNGKILTLDEQGLVYDLGNFLLPYQIKEISGRFVIDTDNKVRTIDRSGIMYAKDNNDVPKNIEVVGENYFITKRGTVYTVDELGVLYEIKKEKEYRNVEKAGSNFFVAETKDENGDKGLGLFVVNHLGLVIPVKIPGLKPSFINYVGGTYFTTTLGELFTVSADGYVYSKKSEGTFNGWELKKSANYFIRANDLYTVASNGIVLNVGPVSKYGTIKFMGTRFFFTEAGKLYTIASNGNVYDVTFRYPISDISHFSRL